MARPTKTDLASDQQGWDATMNDNLAKLFTTPYPVPEAADHATLVATYAAANYDGCVARVADTKKIYYSDGTTWTEVPVGGGGSSISAWTAYDTPGDLVTGWTGGFSVNAAEYRQVGEQYECRGYLLLSGGVTPTSTPLQLALPSELSLSPAPVFATSVYAHKVGAWNAWDSGGNYYRRGDILIHNSFLGPVDGANNTLANIQLDDNNPVTWQSADLIYVHFSVRGA